jgi:hypothetical protein
LAQGICREEKCRYRTCYMLHYMYK